MSDDRMDERLRDYGARWASARPAPAEVPVAAARRGRSWVPYAAAASVVALVAGIAYAVAPSRDAAPPVASGSLSPSVPSATAPSSAPACGAGDVRAAGGFTKAVWEVGGTLDLAATGAPCTIPRGPRLAIVGDGKDYGLPFAFEGDDVPVTLTPTPRRLLLGWNPPFCAAPSTLELRVSVGADVLDVRLDPDVRPLCRGTDIGSGERYLSARWASRSCGTADWVAESVTITENDLGVVVGAVLRNVSGDFCDPNEKPFLTVRDPRGRTLDLPHATHSDARNDPGVAPGKRVRADVLWRAYCGPPMETYTAALTLRAGAVPLALDTHPVPPCREGLDPGQDGLGGTDWLTPVD